MGMAGLRLLLARGGASRMLREVAGRRASSAVSRLIEVGLSTSSATRHIVCCIRSATALAAIAGSAMATGLVGSGDPPRAAVQSWQPTP